MEDERDRSACQLNPQLGVTALVSARLRSNCLKLTRLNAGYANLTRRWIIFHKLCERQMRSEPLTRFRSARAVIKGKFVRRWEGVLEDPMPDRFYQSGDRNEFQSNNTDCWESYLPRCC